MREINILKKLIIPEDQKKLFKFLAQPKLNLCNDTMVFSKKDKYSRQSIKAEMNRTIVKLQSMKLPEIELNDKNNECQHPQNMLQAKKKK